jgi:wobble nucleotide-excising tRNase
MISHVQLLRNIGQFDSVSTGATIPLGRLTLVHSENGRGKTTLAAVLRSLATGDPLPIAERRRLAAQHPPQVVVECSGGPPAAIFENNAWNRTLPRLVVFDDVFIDANVHSGLAVQAHHRQNLHELILGAQAVALSRRLQELVASIEDHNRELRAKESAIPGDARGPYSVNDFCALPARPDIDDAIQDAQRALAATQEYDVVLANPPFQSLNLPSFDLASIERLLGQDLPALDSRTLAQVIAHLADIGQGAEGWVADGVRRLAQGQDAIDSKACPFCGQHLGGSALIQHYRAYFSDAYASLKRDVSAALAAVNQTHGREVPAGFERALRVTVERRQFWSRFNEVSEVTLDTAAIVRDWEAAREAVVAQLSAKQAAPLEAMQLSAETRTLVARFEAHCSAITVVNQRLQEANIGIEVTKERVANANPAALADDLARLKAVKARHEPAIAALCGEYLRARAAKEVTEQQRDQTRAALEQHRTSVFPGYQTAINLYLLRFNAGFRLDSIVYANTRGGPSCTYNVLINNIPVPVDGSDPVPGEPSFRNTLSAGDRNTLALAFFFASLDQDANCADKVVVIDDPISSLDEHRALTTVQEIRRLAERVSQVIVLSHSRPFLCRLWEGADITVRAALEVVREGTGSTLRAWDVAQDCVTEHDRRHNLLRNFLAGSTSDRLGIARSIRPHLEAFLRVACPAQFTPSTLLGEFRHRCQQRLGTPDQVLDQTAIQELGEIVEYANRFHHDTNPASETERINDTELRGFVDRTLRFCRPS